MSKAKSAAPAAGKPAGKRVPVLVLDGDCSGQRMVIFTKIEMLPPTPKGSWRKAELSAVKYGLQREKRVHFEDSTPKTEPTTWAELKRQEAEQETKAFQWLKKLPTDPELRGSRLRSLATRADVEVQA